LDEVIGLLPLSNIPLIASFCFDSRCGLDPSPAKFFLFAYTAAPEVGLLNEL
jgi:hypothetical protein